MLINRSFLFMYFFFLRNGKNVFGKGKHIEKLKDYEKYGNNRLWIHLNYSQ